MTDKQGNVVPWKNCEAKKVLKDLLQSDDLYMEMDKNELYDLSPRLFHPCPLLSRTIA